jgi:hypothetical protein
MTLCLVPTVPLAVLSLFALAGCGVCWTAECGTSRAGSNAPTDHPILSISGEITGLAVTGVTVLLGGTSSTSTTTDAGGAFSFSGLTGGTYSVTPSLAGYVFTPPSASVELTNASVSGVAFTEAATSSGAPPPQQATFTISGTAIATDMSGVPFLGTTLTLTGAASEQTAVSSSGDYAFSGLSNGEYAISPYLAGFTFTPSAAHVTVNGADITDVNFVGQSTSCP